jgi:glycosyltransferase involved in cell wall biosynthesis
MPGPKLSVILPTYNRANILRKTLQAYQSQADQDRILEILVVDDGSSDDTADVVSKSARSSPTSIRYFHQAKGGQAAARNRGIREAQAEIVLLGDDDIIPALNMVAEHLAWHERYPEPAIAVVGAVPWSPEVDPTPLMKWWGLNGLSLKEKEVSWAAGVLCNTSVKLAFLKENGIFDERFRDYGYEDIELCYRLAQKGLRMLVNHDCVGYHYKRVTFSDMCRRGWIMATTPSLKIFESTEAGQRYQANNARRRASRKYRLQTQLARFVIPLLTPLKPLLDSRIPLPSVIYSAFYAYYGSYAARERGQGFGVRDSGLGARDAGSGSPPAL